MPLRVVPLVDLGLDAAATFGGKAEGLARLCRTGADVPAGFAVEATTLPFDDWPEEDRRALRTAAAALLAQGPVAVRSSAVGEDSASRSFAGLFETFLGLTSEDKVADAARKCVASASSERVRAYTGGGPPLAMGLVLQRQVAARAAGVCFTADPAGRDRATLIEAVAGTGDALVSGRVAPERWRVYRSGLGGLEAQRDPGPGPSVLEENAVIAIAARALELDERLGGPLDFEWAIDPTETIQWLQARPITALVPVKDWVIERAFAGGDDGAVTVWANWNVRETMPDPLTPLTWTLWRDVILPVVMQDIFGAAVEGDVLRHLSGIDRVHGRIYWNMNAVTAGPLGALFVRAGAIRAIDEQAGEITMRLHRAGVLRPRRLTGSWRLLLGMAVTAPRTLARVVSILSPEESLALLSRTGRAIAARPPVALLSDEELLREMRLLGEPESEGFRRAQQMLASSFGTYKVAALAFAGFPRAQALLPTGFRGNPTTEMSVAIDVLAERARPLARVFEEESATAGLLARLEKEPEGPEWLAALRAFLDENGQRGPKEFDLGAPRWSEDPTMIVGLVRAGLRARAQGVGETTEARIARLAQERTDAVDEAVAASPSWKRPAMRWLAHRVTRTMPLREAPKHYAMHVFHRMRMSAVEIGSRLFERGAISAAEDVFFLEWPEAAALLRGGTADLRAEIALRREQLLRFEREKPPDWVRSDGVPVVLPVAPRVEGVLTGTGVAGGTATGPVRILREPDPSLLRAGEIMVVEFADPGWTPLFSQATALVMEVGGAMCHAAVVARELGIPAVFGVTGARTELKDGDVVTVDGRAGTVRTAKAGG